MTWIQAALGVWLAFIVGFLSGATWCGACWINKRLDGPEEGE